MSVASVLRATLVLGLATSCGSLTADFICSDNASCLSESGVQGTCELTGRCSLPDTTCTSGRRYATSSGPLSSECTTAFDCIADVHAGEHATCVRKRDGSVWCWGDGGSTPARLALPDGDVAQLEIGGAGVCVRYANGDVHCATSLRGPMTKVPLLGSTDIAVGASHACAVTGDKHVACWGANASGELGTGTTVPSTVPLLALGGLVGVRRVAAGVETTCAVTDGGATWCWGLDDRDQLGRGICPLCDSKTPMPVDDELSLAASVTVADHFACALTTAGAAWCWGTNNQGQLGDRAADNPSDSPHRIQALSGITQLRSGGSHSCAVGAGGAVSCWGDNRLRQSTSAASDTLVAPTPVTDRAGQPLGLVEVVAGAEHSCGRSSDGVVVCWGNNTRGEIGDGTFTPAARPTQALVFCP